MTPEAQFSPIELDALREVANIGCGHAATVLSQMIGMPIMIDVPLLTLEPFSVVAARIAADDRVVLLSMQIGGDLSGDTSFVMREANARVLSDLLLGGMGGPEGLADAMAQSSLMEAGNVMASGFLNALSVFLNRCLLPSPPRIQFGLAGALEPPSQTTDPAEPVLVATTNFRFEDAAHTSRQLQGLFMFGLDTAARAALFATLRHATEDDPQAA